MLVHKGTKKHIGKRPGNAKDTSRARDKIQEHKYMYIDDSRQDTTDQTGETDADA